MLFEEKLKELGLTLPPPPKAIASYKPANRSGDRVFTSGQLPVREGKLIYTGKVGSDVSMEHAREAAEQSCLNALSAVKSLLGDSATIKRIIKVGVYVASANEFHEQHLVANAASDLLVKIFGEEGRHARFAIGVNVLPLNAPVEIEMTVEVE